MSHWGLHLVLCLPLPADTTASIFVVSYHHFSYSYFCFYPAPPQPETLKALKALKALKTLNTLKPQNLNSNRSAPRLQLLKASNRQNPKAPNPIAEI